MRRRKIIKIIIICTCILAAVLLSIRLITSPAQKAESLVNEFYTFEQKGNYSDSWKLLHPFMKEKFSKNAFIQDRAHVFIGHFGAETFSYEIKDSKKVEDWKPAKGEKPFNYAHKFIVTQVYHGKYGKFSFSQEVYVVKYKKGYVILWDYNQ
jgi:predicted small secreted protein